MKELFRVIEKIGGKPSYSHYKGIHSYTAVFERGMLTSDNKLEIIAIQDMLDKLQKSFPIQYKNAL